MTGFHRVTIFLVLLALYPGVGRAAPASDLWRKWLAHDPSSTMVVDHDPWQRFISRYAAMGDDGVVRVDYGRVTVADRDGLATYLSNLAALPVSTLRRAEQLAFWINLYNALTVHVVLKNYPVETIRDIDDSPGLFSDGPWGRKRLTIEGKAVSLDDIEHRILRPIWRDSRVHYLLNCASVGCPNLPLEAITSKSVGTAMEAAAKIFVNSAKGVTVVDGNVIVSRLYDWYGADFEGGLLSHFRRFAEPALLEGLKGYERVAGFAYDWALNDKRQVSPPPGQ